MLLSGATAAAVPIEVHRQAETGIRPGGIICDTHDLHGSWVALIVERTCRRRLATYNTQGELTVTPEHEEADTDP